MPLDSIEDTVDRYLGNEQGPLPNPQDQNSEDETPEQKLAKEIDKEESDQLFDFSVARINLTQLISSWSQEDRQTEANRLKRDIDIDVDNLREVGKLEDDATFVPVRVINTNIERELPPYVNFIKNSRRIAIFTDTDDETFDCSRLEQAFTQGMTYKGWIKPLYKTIDGAATHGWASIEVVYDPEKPLGVGIEYIAHEDLIFYMEAKEIQASQDVLRRYRLTSLQLKSWVKKFGFSLTQVNLMIEKYKSTQDKDKPILVYKRFHKKDGQVYVSWFANEGSCTDWLKKPEPLSCGICSKNIKMIPGAPTITIGLDGKPQMTVGQPLPKIEWTPVPLQNYPVFILPYRETEKPLIFDHLGRCYLDSDKQEAATAVTTGFINGLNRSIRIYASPSKDDMNDGRPAKQLPINFADGTIFDRPMEFWNMPTPPVEILKALEYLDTANSNEVGQVNFAAQNRQDSRKTATEINASQQESQLLDTVDLTLYSEWIRDFYSFSWLIVQSLALQGQISFLRIPNPNFGAAQPPVMSIVNSAGPIDTESKMINDEDTISRKFDVRAAGDVDVIAKAELIAQMQRDWPVVQTTPLAGQFLADYIKLVYPENGTLYSKILTQGDPKIAVIQALGNAVMGLAKEVPPELMTPQVKNSLLQLQQEAEQVVNPQAAQQSSNPKQQSAPVQQTQPQ